MSQNEQNTITFEGIIPSLKVGFNMITDDSNPMSETIMKPWTCILIDDDEIARLNLSYWVKKSGAFQIEGIFEDSLAALHYLNTNPVDVLFLDVDMPHMTGLQLREQLLEIPVCVFVSAYPDYALESFGLDTFDFLQKPVKYERFAKTVDRIHSFMEMRSKAASFDAVFGEDSFVIKEDSGQVKIKIQNVLYLEAAKNYTRIVTTEKKYRVLAGFSNVLEHDCFRTFVRVHKSFAVKKNYVKNVFSSELLLEDNSSIPIGRSYKENLKSLLS